MGKKKVLQKVGINPNGGGQVAIFPNYPFILDNWEKYPVDYPHLNFYSVFVKLFFLPSF